MSMWIEDRATAEELDVSFQGGRKDGAGEVEPGRAKGGFFLL